MRSSVSLLPLVLALSAWAADPPGITLDAAMDRAAQSATPVRAAEAGVTAADARVVQARSGLLPTVQAQAGLQVWDQVAEFSLGGDADPDAEPLDCTTVPPPFDAMCASMGKPTVVRERVTWNTTVRAIQPITGLAGGREQLRAAAAGADAAEAGLDQARARARYDAADAWLSALEADAQLEIARAQVRSLEERERSVAISVEAKDAVRNDLLQIQLALAQARQGVLAVEDLREISWRRLGIATGGDGTALRPDGPPPAPSEGPLPSEDELVARALGDRADVEALGAQLEAAEASGRAAGWSRIPQVSAIASYTHQEGQSLGSPKDSAFVGLTADWTVWGWGRQAAAHTAARAGVEQLEAQTEGMEAGVRLDVAARRRAVETARVSWDVSRQSVVQAEENLSLFRLRYDSGAATTLELLDAESQLVRARSGELSARYGLLRAEAALDLAIGGAL